jgi:hypothetical protein
MQYLQALALRPQPSFSATAGQMVALGPSISEIASRSKLRSESLFHLKTMVTELVK